MTLVWDKFPASGSELLTMLALADWCGDDGGSLYPSMAAVAGKIRASEKQARRIIQGLVKDGYLTVVGNEHGGAPGTTKQFRMNTQKLASLPDLPKKPTKTAPTYVTPPVGVTPPTGVPDPSHPCPLTPPTGGSLTVIDTLIDTSRERERAPAPATLPPALPTPIATPKEPKPKSKSATTTYPTDFAPDTTAQALAQNLGLNLDEEHPRFADHHASKGTRMADWQAAFRNWLRNSAKYAQSEKAPSKTASAASSRQNGAGNTLAQHLADCRSKSVKAIPENHPVRTYMNTVGLDEVMQQMAWIRFSDEHTTGRSKDVLCADWPGRFADSVRGRWYKLWFINDAGVQLTTEGQQTLRWYDAQQQERDGGAAA
ncbi:MAG: hypothetical protein PHX60_13465 [Giesbergeria sp.]|uniref:helix-turn-helix domain-containing protein n=1 Tax=Giesbergeria sp. TaxID=2818473 RepID=UPI002631BE7C|nr:helix-turn-helix domain-containing protein [Giesbergeria sp.]MDD2610668.1 hypothetical protein [Giesbergeria sp.]